MVTNGGYGGVQMALSQGVPLVVAGTTEDKPEVAARVAWSGAGINLKTAAPTPAQVRDAVRALLDDQRYRASGAGASSRVCALRCDRIGRRAAGTACGDRPPGSAKRDRERAAYGTHTGRLTLVGQRQFSFIPVARSPARGLEGCKP